MVGYITVAHGAAQRLSEKWRHFAFTSDIITFCTSLLCVGVDARADARADAPAGALADLPTPPLPTPLRHRVHTRTSNGPPPRWRQPVFCQLPTADGGAELTAALIKKFATPCVESIFELLRQQPPARQEQVAGHTSVWVRGMQTEGGASRAFYLATSEKLADDNRRAMGGQKSCTVGEAGVMLGLGADGLAGPLRSLGLPDSAGASVSIMLYTEEPAPAVEVYWSRKSRVRSGRARRMGVALGEEGVPRRSPHPRALRF